MTDAVPAKGNVLGTLLPARYILAVLGSIGMAIAYGLKVNLSVAVVAMVNHTAVAQLDISHSDSALDPNAEPVCQASNTTVKQQDGPFVWSEPLQGTILSCYFWGYFVSQLPAARIAEQFSAKWVMFFAVAINVVCTLLSPLSADMHYAALILMRIGEGIGGGVTFPAMHVLLSNWAPPSERSVMSAIVYAGTALGTVASMFSAGLIANAWGWEAIFYVMGGVCSLWLFLWIWLVADTPAKQALMDQEERDLISTALNSGGASSVADPHGGGSAKGPVPWKKIFTSGPFLAILIAHTCSNWGWYMLLIELPFYMKQVLQFQIKENAVATSIPFLTMWFFSMFLSKTLDALRGKGIITTTTARKVATLIASLVPMCCLLILCFIGCQRSLAVALMGIAITSIGGMFCGFLSNHIDIAPNYAGTLVALTNTVATLPGITVPVFVGQITHGNQTIGAWRIIFYVTIVLYVIEIIAYLCLGSGEEQPWNNPSKLSDRSPESGNTSEDTPLTARGASKKYETEQ